MRTFLFVAALVACGGLMLAAAVADTPTKTTPVAAACPATIGAAVGAVMESCETKCAHECAPIDVPGCVSHCIFTGHTKCKF